MRSFLLFLLVLSFFPVSAWAGEKQHVDSTIDDVKVVMAEDKVFLGEEMAPSQAKALALNNARRRALEKGVGVNLHSNTLLYDGAVVSDLINSTTRGLIISEKVESGCDKESDRLYCYASIEAHVKPLKGQATSKIKFKKAAVQRPDKASVVDSPVFQHNDEIQVRMTLSEDAYINIFSVDQQGNVVRLLPNDHVESKQLHAWKGFVFPDDSLRTRGIKLRVETPKNRDKAVETVVVIATTEKGHFLQDTSIENPTITDLMKELSELDQSQWAQKTIWYEVRR